MQERRIAFLTAELVNGEEVLLNRVFGEVNHRVVLTGLKSCGFGDSVLYVVEHDYYIRNNSTYCLSDEDLLRVFKECNFYLPQEFGDVDSWFLGFDVYIIEKDCINYRLSLC